MHHDLIFLKIFYVIFNTTAIKTTLYNNAMQFEVVERIGSSHVLYYASDNDDLIVRMDLLLNIGRIVLVLHLYESKGSLNTNNSILIKVIRYRECEERVSKPLAYLLPGVFIPFPYGIKWRNLPELW